ncbi:MAG TPA: hypothetical protein VHJ58_21875 [Vicinamibacterales bacterium]|nr:hypothetical protein [Vicinamibacterales bacterium]
MGLLRIGALSAERGNQRFAGGAFQDPTSSSDDTPEVTAHRVDGSDETTLPMLDYYAKRERLAVSDGSLPVAKLIGAGAAAHRSKALEA